MLRFLVLRSLRALLTVAICVSAVFIALRLAGDPAELEVPSWTAELGWQVGQFNRAVWLAPVRPAG